MTTPVTKSATICLGSRAYALFSSRDMLSSKTAYKYLSPADTAVSTTPSAKRCAPGNFAPNAPVIKPLTADIPTSRKASFALRTFPVEISSPAFIAVVDNAPIPAPINAPAKILPAPSVAILIAAPMAHTATTPRPIARFLVNPSQSNSPSLGASS